MNNASSQEFQNGRRRSLWRIIYRSRRGGYKNRLGRWTVIAAIFCSFSKNHLKSFRFFVLNQKLISLSYPQGLKKKERDMEHEMERLAREKIASQQRIVALKKELSATWDHIDFSALLPEQNSSVDNAVKNGVYTELIKQYEKKQKISCKIFVYKRIFQNKFDLVINPFYLELFLPMKNIFFLHTSFWLDHLW